MKTQRKRTVIAVDDDEINLMILIKSVQEAGYDVKSFASGEAAADYLSANPNDIDIALVDKMMPGMNGLELLRRIKIADGTRHIPVILQTGDAGVEQMREGLENGAYYYLTKPFHPEILAAILHSAANECAVREEMMSHVESTHARFVRLLSEGEFTLKTHAEARVLAAAIAQAASYPEFVALGLVELLNNAIEHGNLEMGYQKKHKALMANNWDQELQTRQGSAEYGNRVVKMSVERTPSGMHLTIRDEGKGFDWRSYLYEDSGTSRMTEPNGRGIAKALIMLDDLRYSDKGNEVQCNISMPDGMTLTNKEGIERMARDRH